MSSSSSSSSPNGSKLVPRSRYQSLVQTQNNKDGTETSQAEKDWTQIKSPAIKLKDAMETISTTGTGTGTGITGTTKSSAGSINPVLYEGIEVHKITSSGGAWKKRILTLSRDNLALFCTHHRVKSQGEDLVAALASKLPIPFWTPSKGFSLTTDTSLQDRYVRYIDVADMDPMLVGVVGTQTLETFASHKKFTDNVAKQIVTLFHHGYEQSLSVAIENEVHRTALVDALSAMRATYAQVQPSIGNDALLLRYIWYDVDVDKSGMISAKEFQQICNRINLEYLDGITSTTGGDDGDYSTTNKAFATFLQKQEISGKEINYGECRLLLHTIQSKIQMKTNLWNLLFGKTTKSINAETLWTTFLQQAQNETETTLQDAHALLQHINRFDLDSNHQQQEQEQESKNNNNDKDKNKKNTVLLHQSKFLEYLHSEENDAYDPQAQQAPLLTEPLDQPISHYWVNTSHNTYLMGDQLRSKSSVQAYVQSLYRGCKCLELDCWDGDQVKKKNVAPIPVVFHGHTLTSKITFRSICHVVYSYLIAHPDSYPIILSLENHCSPPFQSVLASDMNHIFGDLLFVPTPEQVSGQARLPSPESMRGKIVIKGKRPPEPDEGEAPSSSNDNNNEEEEEEDDDPYDAAAKTKSKSHHAKIVPELAKLTLFHGSKFKNFGASIAQDHSHMHSIGETKITKIINKGTDDQPALWRQYNQEHMTRTYPAGFRVDSSNYNPILAWAMGCQLVALNFQTHDTPLLLNDGRFRQFGGCGYVEKPASVMGAAKTSPKPKNVKVRVLSGHCLPKPKGAKWGEAIDPYIKVELHDVRLSESDGKEEYYSVDHKTPCVSNNGFCPIWKDTGKIFQVKHSDVAMILFKMVDEDVGVDDKIACSAIPISCLREGYRSIQLYDHHNTRTGPFQYATLLVKIEFDESDEA